MRKVPLFCSQLSVTWHRMETRDMLVFITCSTRRTCTGATWRPPTRNSSRRKKSRHYRTEFPP
ncbi:hypothetical protein DPMN_003471 [Dreissena polymorpha]|uniref:Uncharacterized protein n=1 Tax=Dreissena polymorpha TaxID=45954 RepID=A0A9D4RUT4_DREPO|nr:hypothetical protein DPMN_003471 [Dreissena polymorpha]